MSDNRLPLRRWPQAAIRRMRAAWHRSRPISPGTLLHTLPGKLVLSLTSHPPRFGTLDIALRSLLSQDTAPDAVVLWIAHGDMARLPQRVRTLERHGLVIRACADLKSHKKIVPAIAAYPGAFILTADDDAWYPRGWVGAFVAEYRAPDEVLCSRARRVVLTLSGMPALYRDWPDATAGDTGPGVFPVGVGGVLYPPGSLGADVADAQSFMALCPQGDDIWLWLHAARSGSRHRVLSKRVGAIRALPDTQHVALWRTNKAGGNDRQLAAMVAAYGLPAATCSP